MTITNKYNEDLDISINKTGRTIKNRESCNFFDFVIIMVKIANMAYESPKNKYTPFNFQSYPVKSKLKVTRFM
jgi:hypothetical protein